MNEKQVNGPERLSNYKLTGGELYDLLYSEKDYAGEAKKLNEIIQQRLQSGGNGMLEAACGTGTYMKLFADDYDVEGFDLDVGQVACAQTKLPGAQIFQADMTDFDTGKQYDVVTCLFSSIGYVLTVENLNNTIANFAKHLKPGGVLIIQPWLKEKDFRNGNISNETAKKEGMTLQRMGYSTRDGIITINEMHHMLGTTAGVRYFVETHKLAMFSDEDFATAFAHAGLMIENLDEESSIDRGLHIGTKPLI